MARTEIKPRKPKMDPIAVKDDEIEALKAEHPVTSRIATESIPRKPRGEVK